MPLMQLTLLILCSHFQISSSSNVEDLHGRDEEKDFWRAHWKDQLVLIKTGGEWCG